MDRMTMNTGLLFGFLLQKGHVLRHDKQLGTLLIFRWLEKT